MPGDFSRDGNRGFPVESRLSESPRVEFENDVLPQTAPDGWTDRLDAAGEPVAANLWTEVVLTEKRMEALSDWVDSLQDGRAEAGGEQDEAMHLAAVDVFLW